MLTTEQAQRILHNVWWDGFTIGLLVGAMMLLGYMLMVAWYQSRGQK